MNDKIHNLIQKMQTEEITCQAEERAQRRAQRIAEDEKYEREHKKGLMGTFEIVPVDHNDPVALAHIRSKMAPIINEFIAEQAKKKAEQKAKREAKKALQNK